MNKQTVACKKRFLQIILFGGRTSAFPSAAKGEEDQTTWLKGIKLKHVIFLNVPVARVVIKSLGTMKPYFSKT